MTCIIFGFEKLHLILRKVWNSKLYTFLSYEKLIQVRINVNSIIIFLIY